MAQRLVIDDHERGKPRESRLRALEDALGDPHEENLACCGAWNARACSARARRADVGQRAPCDSTRKSLTRRFLRSAERTEPAWCASLPWGGAVHVDLHSDDEHGASSAR